MHILVQKAWLCLTMMIAADLRDVVLNAVAVRIRQLPCSVSRVATSHAFPPSLWTPLFDNRVEICFWNRGSIFGQFYMPLTRPTKPSSFQLPAKRSKKNKRKNEKGQKKKENHLQFSKSECKVEHIILIITRFFKRFVRILVQIHVTCGTRKTSFARPLQIDLVRVCDLQQRLSGGC